MRRVPPRLPTSDASFDGGFTFCRVMYSGRWREPGGQGWSTDYPDADINFSIRFAELTKTRVSKQPSGVPNHWVVRLTDPWLYRCPFVLGSDVGTMELRDDEVLALRDYLLKGGFLWVDDFWGSRAWDVFEGEIARVLPPGAVSDQGLRARAPHLPDDVPAVGDPADPVDPVLARLGRRRRRRSAARTAPRCTCAASPTPRAS